MPPNTTLMRLSFTLDATAGWFVAVPGSSFSSALLIMPESESRETS